MRGSLPFRRSVGYTNTHAEVRVVSCRLAFTPSCIAANHHERKNFCLDANGSFIPTDRSYNSGVHGRQAPVGKGLDPKAGLRAVFEDGKAPQVGQLGIPVEEGMIEKLSRGLSPMPLLEGVSSCCAHRRCCYGSVSQPDICTHRCAMHFVLRPGCGGGQSQEVQFSSAPDRRNHF